ncbi:MAG: hypothetical protein ACRDF6_10880 [bacterium]
MQIGAVWALRAHAWRSGGALGSGGTRTLARMREENEGNINANAICDRLADHLRHGRNAAEAAGEERWLAEKQAELGILSRSSLGEIGDVVDEWLVSEMGEEHAALARTAARMYADFLMRHVDLGGVSAWPRGRVDAAFQQWRAQAERGNA